MDKSKCSKCHKIIYKVPCPYCGCDDSYLEISAYDEIRVSDIVDGVVVKGSSEVTIEKGDKTHTRKFDTDVSSSYIVDESLIKADLSKATPNYVRDQIIYNIDRIEQFANENPANKITHEHGFELNLGVFKYTYKKTIEKPK